MTCIKHNYQLVNNRYYLTGELVPEEAPWSDGKSEWRTEKKCSECGELFPQLEADRIKSLTINK